METLRESFKIQILRYLSEVNEKNFPTKYNGLVDLILNFKEKGIQKQDVIDVIREIGKTEELNDGQDEVLIEISNMLEGSDIRIIKW